MKMLWFKALLSIRLSPSCKDLRFLQHCGFTSKAASTALLLLATTSGWSQIGGKTSADGPFTLDNVEDLDTTASGVNRLWLSEYIYTNPDAFQAVSLGGSGSVLASGQTPVGALRYQMPTTVKGGYVSYSFGVPMPSVPGASTAANPGNISSFTHLTFLIRSSHNLSSQLTQVILETNPGPTYPKLYWNYTTTAGTAFSRVTLTLRSPNQVDNAGTLTVPELLSQTRYLSFYFYGGQESIPKTYTVYVDDIQLIGSSSVTNWTLY